MILGELVHPLPARQCGTHSLGRLLPESSFEKGGNSLKKYIAPEMMAMSFAAEEAISAPLEGSNTFNDGELEW